MADFFDDNEQYCNDDDDIVVLHNEETDKDEEFYILATLDVDERWFAVFQPVEPLEDIAEDEVLIYEMVEDNDNKEYRFAPIEDDELLQKVFDEFMKMVEESECDCEECEDCEEDSCEGCEHAHDDKKND